MRSYTFSKGMIFCSIAFGRLTEINVSLVAAPIFMPSVSGDAKSLSQKPMIRQMERCTAFAR